MSTQVLALLLPELHPRYDTDGTQQPPATMPTNPRLQAYRDAERMERGWHTANFPLHIRQNYIDNASGTQACLALRAAMALVREKDVQIAAKDAQIAAKDAQIAARDARIQAQRGQLQLLIDAVRKLRQILVGLRIVTVRCGTLLYFPIKLLTSL